MRIPIPRERFNALFPNWIQPSIEGVKDPYDKCLHLIEKYQAWIKCSYFDYEDEELFLKYLIKNDKLDEFGIIDTIIYGAAADAVSSMELIITHNGIGVSETSSLKPASKEKTQRVIDDFREAHFSAKLRLILALMISPEYRDCTLFKRDFHNPSVSPESLYWMRRSLANKENVRFGLTDPEKAMMEARPDLDYIEHFLYRFIPESLYGSFWRQRITDDVNRRMVFYQIQKFSIAALAEISKTEYHGFDPHRFAHLAEEITQYIADHAESFPEWKGSNVARWWKSRNFKNDKSSSAYWM